MKANPNVIQAAKFIRAGDVIAYPTESVYGLGCDPQNLIAVNKILQIKQRSSSKGLIIVAANIEQAFPYIKPLSDENIAKILSPTDKVITWLIPAQDNLYKLLTGTQEKSLTSTQEKSLTSTQEKLGKKIAIRISQHPIIKALCEELQHPIISTSANISGKPMCWSAQQVKQQLKTGINYILEGGSGGQSKPSEIRDLLSDQKIRK